MIFVPDICYSKNYTYDVCVYFPNTLAKNYCSLDGQIEE